MPRFLARLPYGAKTSPVDEFDFEEDTAGATHAKLQLGQRRLCDGGQRQPLVQDVWLVLADPRHRVRRRGREPADAQLPVRRRRRRHEVPDRDRHLRPARGRAVEERLPVDDPPQELGLRRVHQRPVAAEAAGVRRSRRDRQRGARGAAAVPVRLQPLRALPEVHRARQGRLVPFARGDAELAQRVDPELRRRRSRQLERGHQGQAAARGGAGRGRGDRRLAGLLPVEVLSEAALPARRPDGVFAPGLQATVGKEPA